MGGEITLPGACPSAGNWRRSMIDPRLLIAVALLLFATRTAAEEPKGDKRATPVTTFISPDGRRVAYVQVDVGANGQQSRIVVAEIDGSKTRFLPIESARAGEPDRFHAPGSRGQLEGGNPQGVGEVQWYGNAHVAYVTKHGEDGYFLMDLDAKAARRLAMPGGCDAFHQQCLAPNGKMIAFCGNYFDTKVVFDSDGDRKQYLKDHPNIEVSHGLFVVDLEQQTVKPLLDEVVANLPSWSPDSKYIACGVGAYVRNYPLVIIEVDTGKIHRPEVKGVAGGWSPDGKQLAITTDIVASGSWLSGIPLDGALGVFDVAKYLENGEVSVRRISKSGTNVRIEEPFSWSLRGSFGGVWSPDGKRIAYRRHASEYVKRNESTTHKETRKELLVVHRDGKAPRVLLRHDVEDLAWADDRTLLWVRKGELGRSDVILDGAVE